MSRVSGRIFGFLIGSILIAAPASAQVVQSLTVGGGWFFPRGVDSRAQDDVLVRNLTNGGTMPDVDDSLLFFVDDFRSGHVMGEWAFSFGPKVEVAGGVSYYSDAVPSVYRDLVNADRTEIAQTLHLRIVPITAVVRFMPFGRPGSVQPYVGAGFGLFNYRYSEVGEFVDPVDSSVFDARYIASGNTPGAVLLGGIRLPIGGDIYGVNMEYRYQFAVGDTGGEANGFLAEKIDLSGGNLTFSFTVRF